MNESPLSDLLDEFAPDEDAAEVDDEPIPVPDPAKRKKRKKHQNYSGYLCPCSDCMRKQPARAAEQAAKRAVKKASK